MTKFKEKTLLLGERESMVGIVSEPEGGPNAGTPLFLMINSGIVHRIGPHRKTVQVARGLARAGFRTVRVDLSGIGDSPARRDSLDFGASALADMTELLDSLEALYGVKRFSLVGLCSGADNGYQAAVRDDRLVGGVFIDGYSYKTPEYYVRHYGKRAKDKNSWMNFAKRAAGKVQGRLRDALEARPVEEEVVQVEEQESTPDYVREFPPKEEVAQQLGQLAARGFKMFWIYSGGVARYFNYENQLRDAFKEVDFKDTLSVKYFENANHTFTALRTQRRLVETIVDWAKRTY